MNPPFNSSHFSRRALLRAAGLGGVAWLTPLTHMIGQAQEKEASQASAKSVIILWLAGGASQLETFDPHPGKEIAGDTGAIKTSVKGVEIAEGLPQVAEMMEELTLVRSMFSQEGDHERGTYNVKTGYRPDPTMVHPSIGAVICNELSVDGVDIPRHVSILPGQWPARGGHLGADLDAFKVYDTLGQAGDMTARVKPARQKNRLEGLKKIEDAFARGRRTDLDKKKTLHNVTIQRALDMMNSKQLGVFDVSKAPAQTRKAFGDTDFGRGCLAAVQLVGAGVRCVEVTLGGWDTHINNHDGQATKNAILDPAFAALIRELRVRKLLDETIVICAGEFGRTPKINGLGGRDHWPKGFSVALAGGGFRGGHVHGATDPEGVKEEPKDPVKVADLHTTVMHLLGIDHKKKYKNLPFDRFGTLSEGKVKENLLKST